MCEQFIYAEDEHWVGQRLHGEVRFGFSGALCSYFIIWEERGAPVHLPWFPEQAEVLRSTQGQMRIAEADFSQAQANLQVSSVISAVVVGDLEGLAFPVSQKSNRFFPFLLDAFIKLF